MQLKEGYFICLLYEYQVYCSIRENVVATRFLKVRNNSSQITLYDI